MSHLFSTPPASNRRASLSTPMSAPPAGRILALHEPEAAPDAARNHRALWRGQSAGPEAEAEASQPSPHYLTRGLEALRKKANGVQQPALDQQPMLSVQPHEADFVQVPVPGAPRTALTVAQAVTTAIQLLTDPDMTTEALRARPARCSSRAPCAERATDLYIRRYVTFSVFPLSKPVIGIAIGAE